MTTEKQKEITQEKPQENRAKTSQKLSSSLPNKTKRAKPGTKGEGDYFRINVRPKEEFSTFRYHDVGDKGQTTPGW